VVAYGVWDAGAAGSNPVIPTFRWHLQHGWAYPDAFLQWVSASSMLLKTMDDDTLLKALTEVLQIIDDYNNERITDITVRQKLKRLSEGCQSG